MTLPIPTRALSVLTPLSSALIGLSVGPDNPLDRPLRP